MSHLTLTHLSKSYDQQTAAVHEVTLNIVRGEFVTLLGPSGCGKTTTLRMIAGFVRPTQGEIVLQGRTITSVSKGIYLPPEQRGMGMVFQSYAVWPHMTVFDNVAYPLKFKRLKRSEAHSATLEALAQVKLTGFEARYPHQLSGGQQQRVALARALVMTPDVLLLDEPLSNLDAKLREAMRFEIVELQKRLGITVVYVTHDQAEAMAMSQRVVVLDRGVVQQIATPREIYAQPANRFVADFIGVANFVPCCVLQHMGNMAQVEVADGYRLTVTAHPQSARTGDGVLVVRPEHVALRAAEGMTAQLLRVTYLGDHADGMMVTPNGQTLRVFLNADQHYETGQPVRIVFTQAFLLTA